VPDWQPNWNDVDFDHAAATTAVTECRSSARAIDTALGGLDGLPDTDHWVGRYKDDWSADQGPTRTDLSGTRDDLRSLATAIEQAASEARAEQSRRVTERERWWDEVRAESEEAADGPTPTPTPTGPGGPR
jgi:hypothetical protein